jgi:predicted nucleic acid-binding protein
VTAAPPWGGAVLIADPSAWARAGHRDVRESWRAALRAGRIATCSIATLELLRVPRDLDELLATEAGLAQLRDIPVSASVQRAAIGALRDLAELGPLHHRVPIPDLLIAAAAQDAGLGVLHYDHHYDRLAEVLSFDSRWLAPPGTLDAPADA